MHCSAGIGRTGVLIMMETAMCLIEFGKAVWPEEMLRTMREQRAGLIQAEVDNALYYTYFTMRMWVGYRQCVRL